MKSVSVKAERRRHLRYPIDEEVTVVELKSVEYGDTLPLRFSASVENISADGVCLVTDHDVRRPAVVCCQWNLSGIPVLLPVLMKVQWTQKDKNAGRFRIGLKFLVSTAGS